MNNISTKRGDIALLIARIILGGIFITTGWLQVSDMVGTLGFFASFGLNPVFAYVVSYGQILGGVLVVLGFWTCLASAFLSIIMIGAIWLTRAGGIEAFMAPLALLGGLVSLMGSCGGKYSVSPCCCKKDSTDAPKM